MQCPSPAVAVLRQWSQAGHPRSQIVDHLRIGGCRGRPRSELAQLLLQAHNCVSVDLVLLSRPENTPDAASTTSVSTTPPAPAAASGHGKSGGSQAIAGLGRGGVVSSAARRRLHRRCLHTRRFRLAMRLRLSFGLGRRRGCGCDIRLRRRRWTGGRLLRMLRRLDRLTGDLGRLEIDGRRRPFSVRGCPGGPLVVMSCPLAIHPDRTPYTSKSSALGRRNPPYSGRYQADQIAPRSAAAATNIRAAPADFSGSATCCDRQYWVGASACREYRPRPRN